MGSMTTKPALRIVDQAEQPTDITLELRKDIEARDWARVHIAGDRAKPISIADRIRRVWLR
jgi:hypothetical protein